MKNADLIKFEFEKSDYVNVFEGNALSVLKTIEDQTYNTCITSPPYYAQRDYGMADQLGLEDTPEDFINKLVEIFDEIKRVLKDDGVLWLNIADTYGKDKSLIGIPWKLAFALKDAGWILRQDIIWSKPNPMPEPARDRCARSHEYIFLLTKNQKYYFNSEIIREKGTTTKISSAGASTIKNTKITHGALSGGNTGLNDYQIKMQNELSQKGYITRNKRSVWTVPIKPSKEHHFATYPEELIEPCVLSSCPEDGKVIDPFGGSGTTAVVAKRLGRRCDLIELNPTYAEISKKRCE